MDAVDPALVDTAETSLRSVDGIRDIESLRLRWIGHRMRAEADVLVDPSITVIDGHGIAVAAHHRLLHDVPRLAGATVHVSPAGTHGTQQHAQLTHHQ
jgi:divalent metal cation (Fe/Co/Zn/Cd) transporter